MTVLNDVWRASGRVFMRVVHVLGTVNAHVLFGALYIVGIGLYSIVWRAAHLFKKPTSIGWISESPRSPTLDDLRRQF